MYTAGLGLFSGIKIFNSGLEMYFRKRKYPAVPTKRWKLGKFTVDL
jgi:hypothetical protein